MLPCSSPTPVFRLFTEPLPTHTHTHTHTQSVFTVHASSNYIACEHSPSHINIPVLSTLLTLSACCIVCFCRCFFRLKRALLLRPIPFSLGKSAGSLGGVPRPLLLETSLTEDTPLLDGVLVWPAWKYENNRESGKFLDNVLDSDYDKYLMLQDLYCSTGENSLITSV